MFEASREGTVNDACPWHRIIIIIITIKKEASALGGDDTLGNHREQSQQSRLELGLCLSTLDSRGRTIWVADAHRDAGRRFDVRGDEKLTAFVELESAIL